MRTAGDPPRRIQRKNLALTYPRTEGNKHDLLTFLVNLLSQHQVVYAVVSHESHQDGGSHFHAFVMLAEKFRLQDMNFFDWNGNHPHIEESRSPSEWIQYVKKDGDFEEYGTNPIKKARLERREKIRFLIEKSLDEAIDSNQFSIFEIARRQQLIQMVRNAKPVWPAFMERRVFWYYGPTGTGKTRYAVQQAERYYKNSWCILTGDLRSFMNGYDNQRCVIFDDIRAGTIRFERLLHLTDGYRVYVNIKGGFVEWIPECIIFTAPIRPEQMFVDRETQEPWDHLDQLLRRIDEIIEFPYQEPTQIALDRVESPGPHDVPWLPTEDPAESNGVETMESLITLSPINNA